MARNLRRSKGCWNCRNRKIKCDEKSPTCTQCSRGGRQCSQPQDTVIMILEGPTINTNPTYLLPPEEVASNEELRETTEAKGHKKRKRVPKGAKSRSRDGLASRKAKPCGAPVPPVPVVNIVDPVSSSSSVYLVDSKHLTTHLEHFQANWRRILHNFLPPCADPYRTWDSTDPYWTWASTEPHALLQYLMSAIAAGECSCCANEYSEFEIQCYINSLYLLRKELEMGPPQKFVTDACLLQCLYEVMFRDGKCLSHHLQGATIALELRGEDSHIEYQVLRSLMDTGLPEECSE